MPAQGIRLTIIPACRLTALATKPMTAGIRMAPVAAMGSMIPMLSGLMTVPVMAVDMGFTPAIAAENRKSTSTAGTAAFCGIISAYSAVQARPIRHRARALFFTGMTKASSSRAIRVALHMTVIE